MKTKISKILFALAIVTSMAWLSIGQIPSVLPVSPITEDITFEKNVDILGDLAVVGSATVSGGSSVTGEFKVYSATGADYVLIQHDESDAYFETNDGRIIFQTALTLGAWGDGSGLSITDIVTSGILNYSEIASGTTLSAGKTVRGTWERVLVNQAQTNMVTVVGSEAQIRVKQNLGDGVHAGLWAYFEQSGTVTLASPGQNAAISSTVEGSSGLTLDSGASLSGIVIDSSVNNSASLNGDFDAIWVKAGSSKYDWKNLIRVKPDGDQDVNLIYVDVTGTPTLKWDESSDMFQMNKGLEFTGAATVSQLIIAGTDILVSGEQAIYINTPLETTATNSIWITLGSTVTGGDLTGVRSRVTGNAASAGANVRGAYLEAKAGASKYAAMLEGALFHADYSAGNVTISGDVRGFASHISQGTSLTAANLYGGLITIQTKGNESIASNDVGLMINNEAVSGAGREMDAAFKAIDTNVSANGFGYGLDLSGAVIGTADIILQNGETIKNTTDGVIDFGGVASFDSDIYTAAYHKTDTIHWIDCFDHGTVTDKYNKDWDITSLNTQGGGTNTVETNASHITLTTDDNGIGDNEGTVSNLAFIRRSKGNRSEIEVDLGQTANTKFYFGWNDDDTNAMASGTDKYVLVFYDVSDDANWQIKVGDGTDEEVFTSTTAASTNSIIHCIWVETDGTVHWSMDGTEEDITGSISANKMAADDHFLVIGQAQSVTGAAVIVAEIDYIENEKYK